MTPFAASLTPGFADLVAAGHGVGLAPWTAERVLTELVSVGATS